MTSHYWWTTPTSLLDRYKSSSQKQMPKKKNNQHKRNYLLTSKQQNTVLINSHTTWRTTKKKNGKKNLKLVFHLSVSPTTIHVVKLIPCLSSKQRWQRNEKWRLSCHKTTDNSNLAKHTPCYSFCPHKTKPKVSKWH